ncbi:MAG: S9 family peptidase [Bacteroidales bacterium]|nr:MAG: S9 family peptidase [Bacteroidales bacterium]
MKIKILLLIVFLSLAIMALCQNEAQNTSQLSIGKIMQDPKWIGTSPENIQWSADGKSLFFNWNPEDKEESSLYKITTDNPSPTKVDREEINALPSFRGDYNRDNTQMVYEKNGDLFLLTVSSGDIFQITNTTVRENSPVFSYDQKRIIYNSNYNLFAWDITSGQTEQITNFVTGQDKPESKPFSNNQEEWLYRDQLRLFEVLSSRKERREKSGKEREFYEPLRPKTIYTGNDRPRSLQLSPDGKYVTWLIYKSPPGQKRTEIPDYVTETGYTKSNSARTKVGTPSYTSAEMFIYDIERDTVYQVFSRDIPGIKDQPDFVKNYPDRKISIPKSRNVIFGSPVWSDDGKYAALVISSLDNKDRWIMLLDIITGNLKLLDRQRDEAWIGGPGIGWWGSGIGWMPDNIHIWFQSEESGYSHLYTVNTNSGKKKALTSGKFEIYNPAISLDKKYWYFSSNEVHPGERHFYRMPLDGGNPEQLTNLTGRTDVTISPDEKWFAIMYSTSNHPGELYVLENSSGSVPVKITESVKDEFKSYPWRKPEVVTFKASDGATVYARVYQPIDPVPNGPAVIFVHGAGYLQNAHKWWSSYFREYMFHNFLADHGYTVLDIDYRGSAGYGRDWRTAIYRHMGGKDLSDQVDGAAFLVEEYQADPDKIGIYGGSYGGFITLMAMFTQSDAFAAGAALRAVTDWAHYNHGYTSNILNTPVEDSLAYVNSSPIYYAEGLKGALLICHGMIDDNVHFQDVVRLAQRLIELGKENWELAVYPLERHSFVEPTSWTDEYKRIFKLFEDNLK